MVPEATADDSSQRGELDKRRRIELNKEERMKLDSCVLWVPSPHFSKNKDAKVSEAPIVMVMNPTSARTPN